MKRYLKLIVINAIILIFLLEITSYIYFRIYPDRLDNYRVPTYLDLVLNKREKYTYPNSPRVIDTLYTWCTWHPVNTTFRHTGECFDVVLNYNSLGTRGILPDPNDNNTILFVGDSFVEGWGLEEDSTISERMRRLTNKQVLNLGVGGDIGTTQMSLIYDEFSETFKHKDVFVMFFLRNDFNDNNIDKHLNNRYKPYRILLENDSSMIVYRGSIDSTLFSWSHFYSEVKLQSEVFNEANVLVRLMRPTYSYKLLKFIKSIVLYKPVESLDRPGELTYDENDLKIIETDLHQILSTAGENNANVYMMNLPSRDLFNSTGKSPVMSEEYKMLEKNLSNIVSGQGGVYLSFYDYIIEQKIDPDILFFTCDPHYSNYGVSILTDFIYSQYKND